jgi:AraC-like DNA-binding protein
VVTVVTVFCDRVSGVTEKGMDDWNFVEQVSKSLSVYEGDQFAFFFCPRLARVKRHVDEHYAQSISLAEAAHIAALERTYFCRYFHSKVGVCFADWITRVRINRALLMLMSHDHGITDLAFAVGFKDLRTFERAFKKFAGVTPRECKHTVRRQLEAGMTRTDLRWEEIAPTAHDAEL